MASLQLRDIKLSQTALTGRRSTELVVDAIRVRYKVDQKTRTRTDEVDGINVDIIVRNKIQTVKLPIIEQSVFDAISDALKANKTVRVNFGDKHSTLVARPYALINRATNSIVEGISCTASELNIVSIEEPEFDELGSFDEDIL